MATYFIKPIGSLGAGWAIIRDGAIRVTHPSPLYLGAFLDATLKGASVPEAELIARAITARPEPTYEEHLAHFTTSGPWKPAEDPYAK